MAGQRERPNGYFACDSAQRMVVLAAPQFLKARYDVMDCAAGGDVTHASRAPTTKARRQGRLNGLNGTAATVSFETWFHSFPHVSAFWRQSDP